MSTYWPSLTRSRLFFERGFGSSTKGIIFKKAEALRLELRHFPLAVREDKVAQALLHTATSTL